MVGREAPLAEDGAQRNTGTILRPTNMRLVLQEAFDDLHDKHDKECGSTELRVYNLAECCRILKCPLSKSSIDEASAILDPGQSGIISFENFSMWWFSGQQCPKDCRILKLSANINVLHRYAKSKRGLYRAYTSIGLKRRIEKKEKALRKIEAAKKWRKDKNKWWWSVKEG